MKNKNSWLVRIAILLISIDAASASIVSGAIPLMKKVFNNVASSTIESAATLPSISILIFILLSPYVAAKLGTKKTSLLGLGVAAIFGVLPFFVHDIYLILICRFIYGAGVGLINPLVYTVINHVYSGTEQAEMIGYGSSFTNIVNIILTYTVGFLLPLGWNYSFLAYGLIFVIFLLVWMFSPDVKPEVKAKRKNKETKDHLGFAAWKYILFMYVTYIAMLLYTIKYAQVVVMNGFGTPQQATFILGLVNFINIIVGLIFGKLFKKIGRSIIVVGYVMLLIAYTLIPITANIYLSALLVIVCAFGAGFVASYIFFELFQIVSPKISERISGYALVAINLGIFSSTYVGGFVANMFSNNTPGFGIWTAAALIAILIIIQLVTIGVDKKAEDKYRQK